MLFGLIVGYVVSLFFGMVDFASMKATVQELGVIALPKLFAYTPKFELGAIVSVTLVFLVSAAETIGDTSAVCTGGSVGKSPKKRFRGLLPAMALFRLCPAACSAARPLPRSVRTWGWLP